MKKNWLYLLCLISFVAISMVGCNKDENKQDNQDDDINCRDVVKNHPGYEVWAGNTPINDPVSFEQLIDGYKVNTYDYHFIGSSTTTESFNTGDYKYYIIVARYYACIDAIQFFDDTYYHYGDYTLIGGLAEFYPPHNITNSRFLGAPDGIGGCFGYVDLCPEPVPEGLNVTFPDNDNRYYYNAFITDSQTISSRGGGLTVYVVSGCECDSPQPNEF